MSKRRIRPINIAGLNGRVLQLESANSAKQIVLIYGVHSSIERMYSTAEFLSDYGRVTLPDLPGIGGMDSFYKIGRKASLDNYADYLYTFLLSAKLTKSITIMAMSFGFIVVTRMLQRHPDAQVWVKDLISFVGFGRAADFADDYKAKKMLPLCRLLSTRSGGWAVKKIVFNPLSLQLMFRIFGLFNPKYQHAMATRPAESRKMEQDLWSRNDARTRFAIYVIFFTFDLTRFRPPINLTVYDMTTKTDQYFDPARVRLSLSQLYVKSISYEANMALHAPSIIGDKADVSRIFSAEVKSLLAR
ncbi:MAG TPA: alpha/beta hydrolase [Candidatus Saccharimonadales bacterium]